MTLLLKIMSFNIIIIVVVVIFMYEQQNQNKQLNHHLHAFVYPIQQQQQQQKQYQKLSLSPFGLRIAKSSRYDTIKDIVLRQHSYQSDQVTKNNDDTKDTVQEFDDDDSTDNNDDDNSDNNNDIIQIGMISFDLDDTLFQTDLTIRDANAAQINAMNMFINQQQQQLQQQLQLQLQEECKSSNSATPTTTTASIITEEILFQTTRHVRDYYRTIIQQPITYTTLRKESIRQQLIVSLGLLQQEQQQQQSKTTDITNNRTEVVVLPMNNDDTNISQLIPNDIIDNIFNIWLQERHIAAERYLYNDTIPMLQTIQEIYKDNTICIAAITNGRGNPLHMNTTLINYFNFCISGEDTTIFPNRKPHPYIYQAALQKYQLLFPNHNYTLYQQTNNNNSNKHTNEEGEGDSTRNNNNNNRIWIHIGDCLANDVGASASVGAYAIWYNPTTTGSIQDTISKKINSLTNNNYSTASENEIVQRTELSNQAINNNKIAVRVSTLNEIPDAINDILVSCRRHRRLRLQRKS